MKIYCEKCHSEISNTIDTRFEQYKVGHIICPHCNHKQARYISEADLMLFLGVNCIFYMFASYGVITLMTTIGFNFYLIPAIIAAYIIIYIIQKTISKSIYKNAYFKKEIKNVDIIEDANAITKKMRVQFAAFIFIIIMFGTGTNDMRLYLLLSLVFSIVIFIKVYLLIKNEKATATIKNKD